MTDWRWKRTSFLDETSFQAYSHKRYCYQKQGEWITKPRPKHPPKVNVITTINYQRPTRLIIFEESLKASNLVKYLELLLKDARSL